MKIYVYLHGLSEDQAKQVSGALEHAGCDIFEITSDFSIADLVISHFYMISSVYCMDKYFGLIFNMKPYRIAIMELPRNIYPVTQLCDDHTNPTSIAGLVDWMIEKVEKSCIKVLVA